MRDVSFNDTVHASEKSAAVANIAATQTFNSSQAQTYSSGPTCLHSLFIGRIEELFNYKYPKNEDVKLILAHEYEKMDKDALKISCSEIITVSMTVFKDACQKQDCYYLTMTLSQPFGDAAHHVHLLDKFTISPQKITVTMKDNTPSDSLCGKISECIQKAVSDNDSALSPILRKITENLRTGFKYNIS